LIDLPLHQTAPPCPVCETPIDGTSYPPYCARCAASLERCGYCLKPMAVTAPDGEQYYLHDGAFCHEQECSGLICSKCLPWIMERGPYCRLHVAAHPAQPAGQRRRTRR
jgi:hypothetical protein